MAVTKCENNCQALVCLLHSHTVKKYHHGTAISGITATTNSLNTVEIKTETRSFVSSVEKQTFCPDCMMAKAFDADVLQKMLTLTSCELRITTCGWLCCRCFPCVFGFGVPCWCRHVVQRKYDDVAQRWPEVLSRFRQQRLGAHSHDFYIIRMQAAMKQRLQRTDCAWAYRIPDLSITPPPKSVMV